MLYSRQITYGVTKLKKNMVLLFLFSLGSLFCRFTVSSIEQRLHLFIKVVYILLYFKSYT